MAKRKAKKSGTKKRVKKAARRPAARRSMASRKAAPKKAARKKSASRKSAPRKSAPKKSAPKKPAPRPAMVPNDIGLLNFHLDFTTHAQDDVKAFYTETLGFKQFNLDPNMGYLMIQASAGASMGFMPPMPEMPAEQWMPPKEPSLYMMVKNVDAAYQRLSSRGVSFEHPPQDMPWGHRVTRTRDPEGRWVWLAQTKS